MTVAIEVITHVAAEPAAVFDLALDIDAHTASLARTGESAVTRSGRTALQLGDEVTFSARHLGRRWTMTSRVTAHDRPHRFVDEQLRGPFSSFLHEHLFTPSGSGTRMVDRIRLSAPYGLLGRLAEILVLRPYLRQVIAERSAYIKVEAERPVA